MSYNIEMLEDANAPTYEGKMQLFEDCDFQFSAYILEDGLIAGYGLGDTLEAAYADAWEEFWKSHPEYA